MSKKPVMLMILDGWGVAPASDVNAATLAQTPNLDRYFANFPHTTLDASGLEVGLPEGQIGNSEVGHLNIGAGRIIYQSLTRITKAIKDGDFFIGFVDVIKMKAKMFTGPEATYEEIPAQYMEMAERSREILNEAIAE